MSLEDILGVERYAELLDLFKITGSQGPAGLATKMLARETIWHITPKNTVYTGFTHAINPGEFAVGDIIYVVAWWWPGQITTHTVEPLWRKSDKSTTVSPLAIISGLTPNMLIMSISAAPDNSNLMILNTYNSQAAAGGFSVVTTNVGEDWLGLGGSIQFKVTTVGGIVNTNSFLRAHYFAVRP